MNRLLPLLLLLLMVSPARSYDHWNSARHSALLPDQTVVVRVENAFGAGVENYLLYGGTGIEETAMSPVTDGPSTVEATVPGPDGSAAYYGFRLIDGGELDLMPVRIPDGAAPSPDDLTRVATDASGDELFGFTNLDLVDCRVSFSDTELFAALTNAGGGFPVSQGLGFFGYLLGIANPAQADPDTVLALMYTYEQLGIISPGLYKVTGTGLGELEKLGDVSVVEYPATNTLMITCQLADLMGDAYFQSWYDPSDPVIGVAGFTQRITLLGGAQEADRSPGGECSLREFQVTPGPNALPVLSDHAFEGSGAQAVARIDYSDGDGHCPVLSEIVFDDADTYTLRPQALDYSGSVTYVTEPGIPPLADNSWVTAVFRFSDNLSDVVEHEVFSTGVTGEPTARLALHVTPNPLTTSAVIALSTPAAGPAFVAVYDVRGALVRTLLDELVPGGYTRLVWDGRSGSGAQLGSGVYFLRASAAGATASGKVLLLR